MQEPKNIFKKFGDSARHILVTSQRVAENMKSGIGSEHILLAMSVTTGNIAYEVLKENAINIDQIKLALSLNNIRTNANKGLTKEAKEILVSAAKKANLIKSPTIESEHLLWAILDNKICRANLIIARIGVDIIDLKDQIDDILEATQNHHQEPLGHPQFPLEMFKFDSPPFGQDFMPFGIGSGTFTQNSHKKNSSLISQYGNDLNKLAKENQLDPVIGRDVEIARAIQILCRRTKNNPVLVGEPGVGKTAIVEGLAQRIINNQVPTILKDKRIINLDLSLIVAGTMYRGQFEDRLKKIIDEVIKDKNIILFVDEIHTLVGTGSAEGSMDAANILKPALAKGNIHLIGATTNEEYRRYIEKDAALERRLQVVRVDEPNVELSIKILDGIKIKYEQHHGVEISHEAITNAVGMAKRYIADRYLPDKAIDLIDEAASAKKISYENLIPNSEKINQLHKQLKQIASAKEEMALAQKYEEAAKLKIQESILIEEINKLTNNNLPKLFIDEYDIAKVVSQWTSIPIDNLIRSKKNELINLEKNLKTKIIGQDEAVEALAQAIKRAKSGISNPNRPIGTFIFLGPTGVGKTELAKVLSEEIFSSDSALIKIDMSEFMEKHQLARLVGAPPGYVGYEEAGRLTEAVRKQPYSIILLDEIEKAHPEVFNILLQIMEDGYLTDAKGKKVNFRHSIIILTSNIGVKELNRQAAIGFNMKKSDKNVIIQQYDEMKEIILTQLKDNLRPELINRIDQIIIFKPLSPVEIAKIVQLQLNELNNRLDKNNKISLVIDQDVKDFIAKVGFDGEFGARNIRRKITELVENPISDLIISGKTNKNNTISVKLKNNKIVLSNYDNK